MPLSVTGLIHFPRLQERLATHFVPFTEFEKDAAAGTLPDFSLIEPDMASGHNDYHPAYGRSFIGGNLDIGFDPPSSMLGGEALLQRIYDAYRSMTGPSGTNVWNTALLIGWDEPGGTYDHVPPGPVPSPDQGAPPGEMGFRFDRSGYRVPAIMVSPWVEPGSVYNEEYRHTSLIATLRKVWGLGQPFTQRDASARTFDEVLASTRPRDPESWVTVEAQPVPDWTIDIQAAGGALSTLGKAIGPGIIDAAKKMGLPLPPELDGPGAEFMPELLIRFLRQVCWHLFPELIDGLTTDKPLRRATAGTPGPEGRRSGLRTKHSASSLHVSALDGNRHPCFHDRSRSLTDHPCNGTMGDTPERRFRCALWGARSARICMSSTGAERQIGRYGDGAAGGNL